MFLFQQIHSTALAPTPSTAKIHYARQKFFVDAPLTKKGTFRQKGKNEYACSACTQCIQLILHIQISLST